MTLGGQFHGDDEQKEKTSSGLRRDFPPCVFKKL